MPLSGKFLKFRFPVGSNPAGDATSFQPQATHFRLVPAVRAVSTHFKPSHNDTETAVALQFAAIDHTVRLPGYTEADAAVYFSLSERMRLQANLENLFDKKYYINADSNTNISPGYPRAIRVALTARF